MSRRSKLMWGHVPNRWMAEITYRDGTPMKLVMFEELEELDQIVEQAIRRWRKRTDWRLIEHIVITLNVPLNQEEEE
jgi:hypothetical protein